VRRIAVVVCALAAALLIAVPAGAATSNVNMQNFTFQPQTITVSVGDSVVWHNLDTATHTVTANDGSFNSGDVTSAASYPRTFTQPGTYEYYCKYHGSPGSGMHGTVIVQGGGPAPTQPPAPAPTPAPAATAAPRTTAAPTTTALTTTSSSSTTTTLAPPAAADAGTTTSTTAAAGGGVALGAKKTSSGSDSVSPWLAALAGVLVLGAASGSVLLRRRLT
jgi:plastocyanin